MCMCVFGKWLWLNLLNCIWWSSLGVVAVVGCLSHSLIIALLLRAGNCMEVATDFCGRAVVGIS